MSKEFQNKVVFITGAAHGQERATPIEIAERSAGNLLPVPWVETEDVASSVLFLASEKSRYITGAQFVLDAGLLTR